MINPVRNILCLSMLAAAMLSVTAQPEIPAVYKNISWNADGELIFTLQDKEIPAIDFPPFMTLEQVTSGIKGKGDGLEFDFKAPALNGTLYYGLIHLDDSKHPLPVYFKRTAEIKEGKTFVDIRNTFTGRYDMTGWEESGTGLLGYRIVDDLGDMIYDGKIAFEDKFSIKVINTLVEGPFVNKHMPNEATIWFTTLHPVRAKVQVNDTVFEGDRKTTRHEIRLTGLQPATAYTYEVTFDGPSRAYTFETAPEKGSRKPFTFAYTSDSRSGQGGGERDMHGANMYIMKKMVALAYQQNAKFLQFTGDLINGYLTSVGETNLQYANWKRAVEPYWHYMPINVGMGNHEALMYAFYDEEKDKMYTIDRFPFETESAEAIFAENFVNPENGLESEDGAYYDPDPDQIDFPSYKENVYHYTYGNTAMVVLNSDYLYSPSLAGMLTPGGNIHAYIMDNQLKWLDQTVMQFEEDPDIDHIFVTLHTPAFPNGGHVRDDMWYSGNNDYRAVINGRPVAKGIIERRDEILDILVNKSQKTVALLTGDEHNYNYLVITPDMPRYPENYLHTKLELNRTFYQVNNGAAGAPYYAREETPWMEHVRSFTTQNALVLFHIDGGTVKVTVLNPDTLEEIDAYGLR